VSWIGGIDEVFERREPVGLSTKLRLELGRPVKDRAMQEPETGRLASADPRTWDAM
jgi:hypothetical protein